MSTITPTEPMTISGTPRGPRHSLRSRAAICATVFRGVDWHTYNQLSEATGEGQHVRLIYDGKDLEIMVTGNIHEPTRNCSARL